MPALDDAYANADHIPGGADYLVRWASEAATYRAALADRLVSGLRYGPSERMRFDLFRPIGASQGTVIFVHGGYWMRFHRHDWSHFAAGPNGRGWSVAMPSYDLCPRVSIAMITQQIATAVATIAANTSGPIALTGHSAGGHLVARVLAPGMLHNEVRARLRVAAPISPLSDLTPLVQTTMNDVFQMDVAMARAESPRHQPKPELPVRLRVGGAERPAFLGQAEWLAEAWGCPCDIIPGRHHFDIIDGLQDPDDPLVDFLTSDP